MRWPNVGGCETPAQGQRDFKLVAQQAKHVGHAHRAGRAWAVGTQVSMVRLPRLDTITPAAPQSRAWRASSG